jgi:GT2 family glycosyltransferase
MAPRVTAIVLHYGPIEDTLDAARSLLASDIPIAITVVDNAGSSQLAIALANVSPRITVLRAPGNLGFAAGVNLGLRSGLAGDSAYFFLLNNDAAVERSTIRELLAFADSRAKAGIVGPVVRYAWDPAKVNSFGLRMRRIIPVMQGVWPPREGSKGSTEAISLDVIGASAMLVNRKVLESIGLLDEVYFMYYEDVDFCLRARAAGFEVWGLPHVRAYHKATAGSNRRLRQRAALSGRSRIIFYARLLGQRAPLFFPIYVAISLLRSVVWSLAEGDLGSARAMIEATRSGLQAARSAKS